MSRRLSRKVSRAKAMQRNWSRQVNFWTLYSPRYRSTHFRNSRTGRNSTNCAKTVLPEFIGHPFEIGMAIGYGRIEIGHVEYIGYHHDSTELFSLWSSNNGTAVKAVVKECNSCHQGMGYGFIKVV